MTLLVKIYFYVFIFLLYDFHKRTISIVSSTNSLYFSLYSLISRVFFVYVSSTASQRHKSNIPITKAYQKTYQRRAYLFFTLLKTFRSVTVISIAESQTIWSRSKVKGPDSLHGCTLYGINFRARRRRTISTFQPILYPDYC